MQLQILSPTGGVDFVPYVRDMFVSINRKWTEKMPADAKNGERAEVGILMTIRKDGTLAEPGPAIERSSKKKNLDDAALDAVRAAAPYAHLPAGFSGSELKLRIGFLYNSSLLKPIATRW